MSEAPRGLAAGERAALVISNCQNSTTNPALSGNALVANEVERRGVIPRIAGLRDACRAAGVPVVYATLVPTADFEGFATNCTVQARIKKRGVLRAGHPAAEINAGIAPLDRDLVVTRRTGITDFHASPLEDVLRSLGVETIVLAGVSTNVGIFANAIEAVERGFQVVVPEDCTAGASRQAHEFMIGEAIPLIATVTTAEAVMATISARTVS